jgi:hypothetical protein
MAQILLPMIAALKVPQRLIALIILIAATFLVYWPAQRNGFVWDDTALVLRDPLIRSWRLIRKVSPLSIHRCDPRRTFIVRCSGSLIWETMPFGDLRRGAIT